MYRLSKIIVFVAIFLFLFFATSAVADSIGDSHNFFISSEYEFEGRNQINASLLRVSDKAYWYVSSEYWNNLSVQEKEVLSLKIQDLANEFDNRIYPIETSFWGKEPDPGIDNDSRVTILIARLIDKAGGYFDTTNLYKGFQAPSSNEREMIYLNATSFRSDRTKVFLAHEFQHLVSFNQKNLLSNSDEETWLEEARAEYSVAKLGYDDVYQNSNLSRRLFSFLNNPSDPLGEWKNEEADYGSIRIFVEYLVEHYGDKILVDSLHSSKQGIASLDEALSNNGVDKRFNRIFLDWALANYVNNPNLGNQYSYTRPVLNSIHVNPTQTTFINGSANLTSNGFIKDWQPLWYQYVFSGSGNIKVTFSSNVGDKFVIPVVLKLVNGQTEIKFFPINSNTSSVLISGVGSRINGLTMIPVLASKYSDFSNNDSGQSFNISISSTNESNLPTLLLEPLLNLNDGGLIRFNGAIYVTKGNWVRPISQEAVGLYGHLKSIQPIEVDERTFRNYRVSNYIRPVNSQKVYAVWAENTKHWFNMSGEYFLSSGRSFDAVYVVSEAEGSLYKEGVAITR